MEKDKKTSEENRLGIESRLPVIEQKTLYNGTEAYATPKIVTANAAQ